MQIVYEALVGPHHVSGYVAPLGCPLWTPRGKIYEVRWANDGDGVARIRLIRAADRDIEIEAPNLRWAYDLVTEAGDRLIIGDPLLFTVYADLFARP